MADHLTMSTEHYISPGNAGQPAANTAPMASAAATTSGEVDTATGSEHNGGVNDEGHQENHQENGEESVTEFSDLVSGYEAITVADTALVHQFFYEQTPFGRDVPEDIKSGAVSFDINYLAKWVEGGRNGYLGRVYRQLPMPVKVLIAFHTFLPCAREIRVIWSTTLLAWVYTSFRKPNLVPFVVEGFEGSMTELSRQVFEPAPTMSQFMAYQWFNYDLDALFVDYPNCTATVEEKEEYAHALHNAIRMLLAHRHDNPTLPNFKVLKFSYCPLMYSEADLPIQTTMLESVLGAYAVEIVPHEH